MTTYTVEAGETLWGIAGKHLGDNLRWREIYRLNRLAIVQEQARRQFHPADDEQEYWIFPGTPLVIPEKPAAQDRESVIVNGITAQFRTFGGGSARAVASPISAAMQDGPPVFALGVDVREVVRFVMEQMGRL